MDWAMDIADWKGFAQRRAKPKRRGKLLGRGLANYVESSIGAPREQARIKVQPEGRVDVVIGTQPSGQGHETSFAQVVSDLLHVPVESVQHHPRRHRRGESRRRLAFRPLDAPCRDGVLQGRGRSDRQGQGASPPSSWARRRTASRSATAASSSRDTNRTFDFLELAARGGAAHAARRAEGRHRGRHRQRDARAGVSQRLRHLRGRGRSRHRRDRDHPLRLGRRRRPLHQSADRARPDPWRHRAGRRPGDVGADAISIRIPASRSPAR